MKLKLFIFLFIAFYINHYTEAHDSSVLNKILYSIDNPTNENIIDAYENIINGRSIEKFSCNYSFDMIKQSLYDDEIVIELFVRPRTEGKDEYFAFTVRKQYEVPHVYYLFSEDLLDCELEKGESIFNDTKVVSLLLTPLNGELNGISKIFFTPSGKFHQFAIEYCNIKQGTMLSEEYQFYRLTSSCILANRKEKRINYEKYNIYGGIDFEVFPEFEEKYEEPLIKSRLGYLIDSYFAALDIERLLIEKGLCGNLYANEEATEQSFKTLLKDYQLFFIETHGVISPYNKRSDYPNALMFAGSSYIMDGGIVPKGYDDGLLTCEEIAVEDMSNIDLAIISACKSGLGDITWKGVNGLMRSFKAAGVNSLIMTTNDVLDYLSGEIWKLFFRNLLQGNSKYESLLNAIKVARTFHDGIYSYPKFWSSYILIDGID